MAKKIISSRGIVSSVKTFHADGSPEIRLTLLAGKKRIDMHLFDVDNPSMANLGLGKIVALAASDQVKDGHKIEIGPGNLSDFEDLGAKGKQTPGQPGPGTPNTPGGTPATPAGPDDDDDDDDEPNQGQTAAQV